MNFPLCLSSTREHLINILSTLQLQTIKQVLQTTIWRDTTHRVTKKKLMSMNMEFEIKRKPMKIR